MSTYTVSGITYDTATGRPINSDGSLLLDSEIEASSMPTVITNTEKSKNPEKKKEENKSNKSYQARVNQIVSESGKQGKPEKFNDLRYPYSTIESGQDFIKFSAFKYKREMVEMVLLQEIKII